MQGTVSLENQMQGRPEPGFAAIESVPRSDWVNSVSSKPSVRSDHEK